MKTISTFGLPVKNHKAKVCESCLIGKMHQGHYSSIRTKSSSKPLELVYADVWGPALVVSSQGNRYYVNFVDDFTRYNWLYLIPTKSSIHGVFIKFKNMIENDGGEFLALRLNT